MEEMNMIEVHHIYVWNVTMMSHILLHLTAKKLKYCMDNIDTILAYMF